MAIAKKFFLLRDDQSRPKRFGPRINERIRVPQVRLIGAQGEQMGIVPIEAALKAALDVGLDLVEVAPDAKPPVCRLMDHGKHKFEEEKRRRESKKKEASNKLRMVRFRPNIGDHDFEVKMRKLRELLERGEKCRVSVTFRKREMRHVDVGVRVLERVSELIQDLAKIESRQDRLMDGRDIGLTCIPVKTKAQLLRQTDGPGGRRVTGGKKARKLAAAQASGEGGVEASDSGDELDDDDEDDDDLDDDDEDDEDDDGEEEGEAAAGEAGGEAPATAAGAEAPEGEVAAAAEPAEPASAEASP